MRGAVGRFRVVRVSEAATPKPKPRKKARSVAAPKKERRQMPLIILRSSMASRNQMMPGTWCVMRDLARTTYTITVKCPCCHDTTVVFDHCEGGSEIKANGDVQPLLVCTHPPCGWQAFVNLDGWEPVQP